MKDFTCFQFALNLIFPAISFTASALLWLTLSGWSVDKRGIIIILCLGLCASAATAVITYWLISDL